MNVPLHEVLGLSAILFGIGMFGFLARSNLILMLISIEVMLNAVNLSLAAFSRQLEDPRGQVLALLVIAVAAFQTYGLFYLRDVVGLDNPAQALGRIILVIGGALGNVARTTDDMLG